MSCFEALTLFKSAEYILNFKFLFSAIDLFTDTAAILNSIVSNSYYGMPRGQISMICPPEHPIIDI